MLKIVVDDREQVTKPFFVNIDIEVEHRRLTYGDYAIFFGDTLLFTIERKTWKDLAASIKDGRKKNIENLLELRNETNCRIFYLIEGQARYPADRKIARIPFKNLQAHLDHLIIRDNVSVIYSTSAEDTPRRLSELCKNYMSLGLHREISGGDHSGAITRKIIKRDEDIILSIWKCMPNITDKTAALFMDKYHISDLLLEKIPREDISALRYPSGAIIGNRADKILQAVTNPQCHINILTCINGITKKTAGLLLEQFSLPEIMKGKISQEQIADVKKSEKRKIGKKVAEDVVKFFVK